MNRSSWNTHLQSRCVWVLEGRSSEPKSPRQRCFSLAPTHSPWNTQGFLRTSTLLMKTKGSFLLMESFRTSLSQFNLINHPFSFMKETIGTNQVHCVSYHLPQGEHSLVSISCCNQPRMATANTVKKSFLGRAGFPPKDAQKKGCFFLGSS